MPRATRGAAERTAPHTANEAASSMLVSEINAKTQLHDDQPGGLGDATVKPGNKRKTGAPKAGAKSKRARPTKKQSRAQVTGPNAMPTGTRKSNSDESTPVADNDAPPAVSGDGPLPDKPEPKPVKQKRSKKEGAKSQTTSKDGADAQTDGASFDSGPKPQPRKAKNEKNAPKTTDEKESSMLVSELNAKVDKQDAQKKRKAEANEKRTGPPSAKKARATKASSGKGDKSSSASATGSKEQPTANPSGRKNGRPGKPSKYPPGMKNNDKYVKNKERNDERKKQAKANKARRDAADNTETIDDTEPALEESHTEAKPAGAKGEDLPDGEGLANDTQVEPKQTKKRKATKSKDTAEDERRAKPTSVKNSAGDRVAADDSPTATSVPPKTVKTEGKSKRKRGEDDDDDDTESGAPKTTSEKESSMLISELNAKVDKKDAAKRRAGAAEEGTTKEKTKRRAKKSAA